MIRWVRFIWSGTRAAPSFRRAALDNTISWVSVSFAMFFSCACDSIGCHQQNPALARGGLRGAEKGGFAARRLTPSNALVREEVQPDSESILGLTSKLIPALIRGA
jgi:hypothetical protein